MSMSCDGYVPGCPAYCVVLKGPVTLRLCSICKMQVRRTNTGHVYGTVRQPLDSGKLKEER